MAAQPAKSRKSADSQTVKSVKLSVSIDVPTNARLAAAAAMESIDKSTYVSRLITEDLKGFGIFDRRKSADGADPSNGERSARGAGEVE